MNHFKTLVRKYEGAVGIALILGLLAYQVHHLDDYYPQAPENQHDIWKYNR